MSNTFTLNKKIAVWWGPYNVRISDLPSLDDVLIIDIDGSIRFHGKHIKTQYNDSTSTLSFNWVEFDNGIRAKAFFKLSQDQHGKRSFQGTFYWRKSLSPDSDKEGSTFSPPLPSDPSYHRSDISGMAIASFPLPSISNAFDATFMLANYDKISISASNQKYIKLGVDGRLTASASKDEAISFQVVFLNSHSIVLRTNFPSKYVIQDSYDNCLYASNFATEKQALVVHPKIVRNGTVIFGSSFEGYYWTLRDDEAICIEPTGGLGPSIQFGGHFRSQTTYNEVQQLELNEAMTSCEKTLAQFIWQITGGAFIAFGFGPLFAPDEMNAKLLALLTSNQKVVEAINYAIKRINTNQKPIHVADAVATVLLDIYNQGLLWPVIRLVINLAGWRVAFYIVAKILETVLLPKAELKKFLASLATWSHQTATDGIKLYKHCGPVGAFEPKPTALKTH